MFELASLTECDVPTVCDDVCEDIDEVWIEDLTPEEDADTPGSSGEISSGYIQGILVGVNTK